MLGAIRHSDKARALFAALALLVLAMRVVMPSGFMPVATAHGVVVTLCTGQGAVNVIVDHGQAPAKPEPKSMAGEHCPFAGGAAPLLADAVLGVTLPAWQLPNGPVAFALRTGWIARLAAPPPPSSGPPAAA
ncbi:MAG: DUF2946 family protein [Sphingobium phenoxybenzoativorans]|uniref:DUF2946 domain-containing protein n=1 Tax=Sphingobium phenoxybenzoativorans TaxID=1592790 RepID=A0A975Q336_9SPHN|nr:DUF2946 family protein [Sphingobium phenoxybenzoativorans]QUT07107.1 hypothetical protein KFK14_06700 [Sphingobium phenoxybenzoativorans]